MRRVMRCVCAWTFVAGTVAGICACAGEQKVRGPAKPAVKPAVAPAGPIAPKRASTPVCEAPRDRPAAGEAAVQESPDQGGVLVRYSATPHDAPCETLDILFRLRDGMLIGEPSGQVELVWTAERRIDDGARVSFLAGSSAIALPSELRRRGSRVEVSTRASAAALAQYGVESRPTFVIADRKIELSARQKQHLETFLHHLPFHGVVRPRRATQRREAAPQVPVEADPAAGRGWFCVEGLSAHDPKKRTSSCHRTAAECEESRASIRAMESRVSDCISSSAAECYSWRSGTRTGRSCFYRPSQCKLPESTAHEKDGQVQTSGCSRVE